MTLAFVLTLSIAPAAFAASDEAVSAANNLHELGLFNGIGTNEDGTVNYDLDRTMTREQAVTMLVRLLGKEEEAKAGTWQMPFTDVSEWAKSSVGYAYANKLTSGTSATTFSGTDNITATQYLTFVLRSLGYESGSDFQWDKAWELTDKLGITKGQYNAGTRFERSDAVVVSSNALSANLKGQKITLLGSFENTSENKNDSDKNAEKVPTSTTENPKPKVSVGGISYLSVTGGDRQIALKWGTNKLTDISGYEIHQATEEYGTYILVKTMDSKETTSIVIDGLASASTYYYKVRAYYISAGKYYYGSFSLPSGATTKGEQGFRLELPTTPIRFSSYEYSTGVIERINYKQETQHDGSIEVSIYVSGKKTWQNPKHPDILQMVVHWALIEIMPKK